MSEPTRIESLAVGEGVRPSGAISTLLSGWAGVFACGSGSRHGMTDLLLPGDVFTTGVPAGDHELVALTRVQIRHDDRVSIGATLAAHKAQEQRLQAQILRLGGMAARDRLVHVLLELHDRLSLVGMVEAQGYRLPLTQERLADFLGVTVVHLNRTLQALRRDGLIQLAAGRITLADLETFRGVIA